MKYFIDFEFSEDFTNPIIGKRRHYIEMISVGIVSSDGREYYAVSNEFDIRKVWNKWQIETWMPENSIDPNVKCNQVYERRKYWLRDNVLKPILGEFYLKNYVAGEGIQGRWNMNKPQFWMFKAFGKSNDQIAREIKQFVIDGYAVKNAAEWGKNLGKAEFYGYYADYDWVLLCSLFGRMIDLPSFFPMYCRDLKQMLDEGAMKAFPQYSDPTEYVKHFSVYPQQSGEHHALADARWNKRLYDFIKQQF